MVNLSSAIYSCGFYLTPINLFFILFINFIEASIFIIFHLKVWRVEINKFSFAACIKEEERSNLCSKKEIVDIVSGNEIDFIRRRFLFNRNFRFGMRNIVFPCVLAHSVCREHLLLICYFLLRWWSWNQIEWNGMWSFWLWLYDILWMPFIYRGAKKWGISRNVITM